MRHQFITIIQPKSTWQHGSLPQSFGDFKYETKTENLPSRKEMGSVEGAGMIYVSRSKSQDYYGHMNSTNYN
jgi:hypothetical protein